MQCVVRQRLALIRLSQLNDLSARPNEAPTGFVIANDMDRKRAYMLSHQCRRFVRLFPLIVACH